MLGQAHRRHGRLCDRNGRLDHEDHHIVVVVAVIAIAIAIVTAAATIIACRIALWCRCPAQSDPTTRTTTLTLAMRTAVAGRHVSQRPPWSQPDEQRTGPRDRPSTDAVIVAHGVREAPVEAVFKPPREQRRARRVDCVAGRGRQGFE